MMNKEAKQFTADYLPLQPAMQRMAEHLLGNEQEAADVVQDCFVSLWNDREKLNKVVNREAWCITMVKRRCVDVLRKRRPTVDIDERMSLADPTPEEDFRLKLAMELIDQLPERQAQAVRMKHFDAADTQHIARAMNINEGNVYTLLSRAYTTLKERILQYEKVY